MAERDCSGRKKSNRILAQGAGAPPVPVFKVDPLWPKPFPAVKGANGNFRRWATGEVGRTCVDSHDHIFMLNRGWQNSSLGKLHQFEAMSAPPTSRWTRTPIP